MLCPGDKRSKELSKGCLQRTVCGSLFWDIMIEKSLLLFHNNKNASDNDETNNVLTALGEQYARVKLTISTNKTTYVLMKGNLQRDLLISLEEQAIIRSTTTRYLGIQLDEKLNPHVHAEAQLEMKKGPCTG